MDFPFAEYNLYYKSIDQTMTTVSTIWSREKMQQIKNWIKWKHYGLTILKLDTICATNRQWCHWQCRAVINFDTVSLLLQSSPAALHWLLMHCCLWVAMIFKLSCNRRLSIIIMELTNRTTEVLGQEMQCLEEEVIITVIQECVLTAWWPDKWWNMCAETVGGTKWSGRAREHRNDEEDQN